MSRTTRRLVLAVLLSGSCAAPQDSGDAAGETADPSLEAEARENVEDESTDPPVHRSSMGPVERNWALPRLPVFTAGDWILEPTPGLRDAWDRDAWYSRLVFRLREDPAECRLLEVQTSGEITEIGTMPWLDGSPEDGLYLGFTGDFHLTVTLDRLLPETAGGTLTALFCHAGSGRVFAEGGVHLVPVP